MKRFILLVAFVASTAFAAVNINHPIPELALKDGRTLKNVVFVSYSSSAILAKWEGGGGTIPYEALPADVGEAVKMMRPNPSKATAPQLKSTPPAKTGQEPNISKREPTPAKTTPTKTRTLTGQVFVTMRGAGAYKFSGTTVVAYPYSILDEVQKAQRMLAPSPGVTDDTGPREYEAWLNALRGHEPCGGAVTDADGKYSLQPSCEGDIFLICYTTRIAAGRREYKLWVVKSSGDGTLNLDGTNSLF